MGHSRIDGSARRTRRRRGSSVFASPARKWNAHLAAPIHSHVTAAMCGPFDRSHTGMQFVEGQTNVIAPRRSACLQFERPRDEAAHLRLDTYLEFIRFVRSDLKAEQIDRLLPGLDGRPRREALHEFVST